MDEATTKSPGCASPSWLSVENQRGFGPFSAAWASWSRWNWRPRTCSIRMLIASRRTDGAGLRGAPLKVEEETYPAATVEYVTLTDGGVYDNLGVNPLLRDRNELAYAIVSDGGSGPLRDPRFPNRSSS
jgi:hypothetical protein